MLLAYQIFLLAKNMQDEKLCLSLHISNWMVGFLGSSQLHQLPPPQISVHLQAQTFELKSKNQYGPVSGEFEKDCIKPASVVQQGSFLTAGLIVFVG